MLQRLPSPRIVLPLLSLIWIGLLMITPPEKTLGSIIRWVYAHASITQVSLILFLVAIFLAIAYLLGSERSLAWMEVVGWTALALWLFGFLLSTIPAKLSWGVWVDFSEPRTQMTLRVLAVGVLFILLTRWVSHPRFTALAQIALSGLILYLNRATSVIRHPLNPIGQANDPAMALTYSLIFLVTLLASVYLILAIGSSRQARPREQFARAIP